MDGAPADQPLLPNPAIRPGPGFGRLSALTAAALGDPNLFAGVSILDSFQQNRITTRVDTHFGGASGRTRSS